MKKLVSFTLVRKHDLSNKRLVESETVPKTTATTKVPKRTAKASDAVGVTKDYSVAEQAALNSVKTSPEQTQAFENLGKPFKNALINSYVSIAPTNRKSGSRSTAIVSRDLLAVTQDLARSAKVFRVGLLDMGAWIGNLPKLLERLNAAQPLFTIFEIQAPVPSGLLRTPSGMAEWAAMHMGPQWKNKTFAPHMISDDFFAAAADIRRDMGLDLIVGMTPAMVAGTDPDGTVFWNHFSDVVGKKILISTADLRTYSENANRPFEAGIGVLLVSALLVAVNKKLEYHDDTGCIFDYNESRISLVGTLKQMIIDDQCLDRMTPVQRDAATNMVAVLKRMKRRRS